MDWDTYMEKLNEQQEILVSIQNALSDPDVIEVASSGMRTTKTRAFTKIENLVLQVWSQSAHSRELIGLILQSQIEFNKTTITMLTDLDYRKSEESHQ